MTGALYLGGVISWGRHDRKSLDVLSERTMTMLHPPPPHLIAFGLEDF